MSKIEGLSDVQAELMATVPAVVRISAKCSDLCWTQVLAHDGAPIHEHNGYVPEFFPDEHYGDYVMLDIDLKTGKILNWKKPTAARVRKWIKENPSDG
jgi:hypothetical protein